MSLNNIKSGSNQTEKLSRRYILAKLTFTTKFMLTGIFHRDLS